MNIIITYTNQNNESLRFMEKGPFFLQNFEGFDAVENIINREHAYKLDGAIPTDSRLATRRPFIEGILIGNNEEDLFELRRNMIQTIDNDLPGTLYVNIFDKTYEIDVMPITAPKFKTLEANGGRPTELNLFTLDFEAFDPYWKDTSFYNSLIPLSKVVNLFEFPLNITNEFEFATVHSGDIIEIKNNGDKNVGAEFFMSIRTTVENPRIYNVLTQEYFGFEGTYEPGTEFYINTSRGHKRVTKTLDNITNNAMSKRLSGSTFLTIQNGTNHLQVQADSGTNGIIVNLKFRPLVLGV